MPPLPPAAARYVVGERNRRNSDWFFESWQGLYCDPEGEPLAFIVNAAGTPLDHYATYPPKLVEPMILAGTSERGVCGVCGAPWQRLVEVSGGTIGKSWHPHEADLWRGNRGVDQDASHGRKGKEPYRSKFLGWKPGCECGAPTVPATVLDPFWGSGCTGMVATGLGRQSVGCELNPQYFQDSHQRDGQAGLALL